MQRSNVTQKSAKVEDSVAVTWISLRMLFHTSILMQVGNSDQRNQDKSKDFTKYMQLFIVLPTLHDLKFT